MTVNRETIRDALVALLDTALTGVGNPAQAVYGYQPDDFGGNSPVVTVSSAGSARPRATFQGNRATFYLNIHILALLDDGADWHEDDAEDAIDEIEMEVAVVIAANQGTTNWSKLAFDERSVTGYASVGGNEYRLETIPIVAEVIK